MGLPKGKTNNLTGRPPGSPNRLTKEMRSILKNILANELENLPVVLEKLKPADRIEVVIKILPYVLPKVESVSMGTGEPWDVMS